MSSREQADMKHKLAFILTGYLEHYLKLDPCPAISLAEEIAEQVTNTYVTDEGYVLPVPGKDGP